jgi:hypothetical protein
MPRGKAVPVLPSVEGQVPTLANAELYGSELVAALDRQHPRDIFDVQHMYGFCRDKEGEQDISGYD